MLLDSIKARFGFVPPFFLPAADQPEVLSNLWHQTLTAYVDNPLPALFKEKLAAYLGRYCAVPYCLACHTCTLHPLGMGGEQIIGFLRMPLPSPAEVTSALESLGGQEPVRQIPDKGPIEQSLLVLSGEVYLQGSQAPEAREALARALGTDRYNLLVVFISYNKMCHQWMEAHPDVSYEMDQRYISNIEAIAKQAPAIRSYFGHEAPWRRERLVERMEHEARLARTVAERVSESDQLLRITEARLQEVSQSLQARAEQAALGTARAGLEDEIRMSVEFAGELLAIVSHDLRNPLSAIMAAATMLRGIDPANEQIALVVNRIIRSTRRASRLVGDLLDFSLARMGGGIPLNPAPADIHDLTRQAVDEAKTAHPDRHLFLDHGGTGEGCWDVDRITQVLSNLLGNALAHSPADAPIQVTSLAQDGQVSVAITNSNRGGPIPAQLLPTLFEPFKRGTQSSSSKTRNIGLGLYIVDHVVRAHGGRVDVRSDEQGTCFTIHLPCQAADWTESSGSRQPSSQRDY